jgi:hypothetical protein
MRKHLRQVDRDPEVNEKVGERQIESIVKWGVPREGSYDYLKTSKQPALVVNGNKDLIVYTVNLFILQQNIPRSSSSTPTPITVRRTSILSCS